MDEEKKEVYNQYNDYFITEHGLKEIEVIDLFRGARGTIPKFIG